MARPGLRTTWTPVAAAAVVVGGLTTMMPPAAAAEPTAAAVAAAQPGTPAAAVAERLDRGLISIPSTGGNFVGWRRLVTDPPTARFNLYRDGSLITATPLGGATSLLDAGAPANARYTVRPVLAGVELAAEPASAAGSLSFAPLASPLASSVDVPLQIPPSGTTPSGESYSYSAGDGSVGDLDGDGQYEIVLKWDPSNAKDNSQAGYTGNTYLDAYRLNGTRLWRIDFGRNIRSGAHYTQFQVFDYDGDGRAEVAAKTADATVDGSGRAIGNASADHRNSSGYILAGPEFLTVFDGRTGAALSTVGFVPPRGNVADWGDGYGNRVDRFLAGTAYVDGSRPSIIMARGYYTRSVVSAWDWRGGALTRRWTFDSRNSGYGSAWEGQGNHQLSVADTDGDGRDEIVYGSMTIDDNGAGAYTTGLRHGDALHVGPFVPGRAGQQVWSIHESGGTGASLHDARTGAVIFSKPNNTGAEGPARGVADDIYAGNPGAEYWAVGGGAPDALLNSAGNSVGRRPSSANFLVWWDGDAQRELLDGNHIDKYGTSGDTRLLTGSGVSAINGTKSTPVLSADILGDWREEVIWRTSDNRALRIYSTTDSTSISRPSLMQDRQYRVAVAWQNTAYNQPPHPSFTISSGGGGGDTTAPTTPGQPSASGITSSGASLSWTASTDSGGSGLAGYVVYREQGATDPVLAQPSGTSTGLTGLTQNTRHQVYVRARDGAGNLSTPSGPVTFTTLPSGGGGGPCRVAYSASGWGGSNGFTASVTITNTGSTPINGWTLRFSFTAGQRLTEGWSATWEQAVGSAAVSATNLSWNAAIAPGASVGVGFNGSHTGTNPPPASFTLNGSSCS